MSHALRGRAVSLSMSTALFAGLLYSLNFVKPIMITIGTVDSPPMDPITIAPLFPTPHPTTHPKTEPAKPKGEDILTPIVPPKDETIIETKPDKIGPIDEVQPKIMDARWLRRPTMAELIDFYPAAALDSGIGGRVVLNCLVGASGEISCAVISETPAGQGFARAALRASRIFKIAPMTANGQPTAGGRIEVPIVFRPPPG